MDHVLTRRACLYFLFFLSGSTSLVYQVLWTRRLTLILGHSVLAVSSVVSITMAGLALGAWVAGRASLKTPAHQVRRYAVLELFIGLWALLSFALLDGTASLYLKAASWGWTGLPLYLTGLVGAILVLLPPTAAMGATLPLLTTALVGEGVLPGLLLSELYGINTLGAFAGAALAGFALLPLFGSQASLGGAAALNLAMGLAGRRLSKQFDGAAHREVQSLAIQPAPLPRPVLLAFGLVGVASMIFQIGWTRGLVLTLGSSTYSFAAVLSIFLLGIALGSSFFALLPSAWVGRLSSLHVGLLVLGGGAAAGLSAFLLGYLPLIFIFFFSWTGGEFSRVLALQLSLVALIIGPTCIFMGLVFPALHQVFGRRDTSLGRQVGQLYAANTVGCILGALVAGFFLIPNLGVQATLQSGVVLQLLGCFVFLKGTGRFLSVPVAALVLLMPTWNPGLMAAGSGVYSQSRQNVSLAELRRELWLPPSFYKDGLSTTVSVHVGAPGRMTVRVNGKVDASLIQTDRQTMYLAGYMGALFAKEPERAAVIGLGSGMTLEALSHFPHLQSIECAELEPAMLEANRFWSAYNGRVLEDPRVKVRLTDGRTMLQSSSEPYDLIVSEPSNPWIAGVGDLFTKDFFTICRDRLADDGVMIQWFHFYNVSDRELGMVFKSFYEAFPHGSVWLTAPGDLLMIGSKKPMEPSLPRLRKLYQGSEKMRRRFFEIGLISPESVMGLQLFDRKGALEFDPEAPLNTDDRPLLEFTAPLHLFQPELVISNLRLLLNHAGPPSGDEPAAWAHAWLNFRGDERLRRWLTRNGDSPGGKFVRARFMAENSLGTETQKAYESALDSALDPALVAAFWGELEFKSGRMENAALLFRRALKQKPDWFLASTLRTRLGQALTALGEYPEALEQLDLATEDPLSGDATYTNLAVVLMKLGESERAQEALRQSLRMNAYSVEAWLGLGYLNMTEESWSEAVTAYTEALKLVPDSAEALVNKGMCLARLGRKDEAEDCFRRALLFHPNHQVARHNLDNLSN